MGGKLRQSVEIADVVLAILDEGDGDILKLAEEIQSKSHKCFLKWARGSWTAADPA